MEPTLNTPILLYTEQTPNPESLKFVTNKMLYRGTADFRESSFAKDWSPLATALFDFPFVRGVYICNNFVTITKELNFTWEDIMIRLKEFIKKYVDEGGEILNPGFEKEKARIEAETGTGYQYSGDEAETVNKIKNLIDSYVKPAVEMDGGNIEFKSYDHGVVTVILEGSCSGCPSSTVTLKAGIEGMLKRMIPEVREVISEMG